eukprot:961551-Rhodomonas_salina.1
MRRMVLPGRDYRATPRLWRASRAGERAPPRINAPLSLNVPLFQRINAKPAAPLALHYSLALPLPPVPSLPLPLLLSAESSLIAC